MLDAVRELRNRDGKEAVNTQLAYPAAAYSFPADAVDVNAYIDMTVMAYDTGQWGVRRRQNRNSKAHHAVLGMDWEWRLHQ